MGFSIKVSKIFIIMILSFVFLSGCLNYDVEQNSKVELASVDFQNKVQFNDFINNMTYENGCVFSDASFKPFFKELMEVSEFIFEEKSMTYEDLFEQFHFSYETAVYFIDIDNDGNKDVVLIYENAGTGNFSGIDAIFIKNEENNTFEYKDMESIQEMVCNGLRMGQKDNKTYMITSSQGLSSIYQFENEQLVLLGDELVFVDNTHLDKSNDEIDKAIYEKYEIEKILEIMSEEDIDFSNSGYENKAILISLYKMKDYIASENHEALASMVLFPVFYQDDGATKKVYNIEEFLDHYDQIITMEIKELVEESTYRDIFTNWKGAMLGNGNIWFGQYIYSFL